MVTGDEKWIHYSNPKRKKSWGLPVMLLRRWLGRLFTLRRLRCVFCGTRSVLFIRSCWNRSKPYSPDIAPSDYYLFRSMAHGLADQQFCSYEDFKKRLDSWIASKDKYFYRNGIRALPERWEKIIANNGQYFEWFICNRFFTKKLHFHQKTAGT